MRQTCVQGTGCDTALERSIDAINRKLDPEYDQDAYTTPEKKVEVFNSKFDANVRNNAFRIVTGATPVKVIEGEGDRGGYEILVGIVWTQNLSNLALSLLNETYNMRPEEAGKFLGEFIPDDPEELVAMLGARVVVNEQGQRIILAYGQAQPQRTAPEHARDAEIVALKIAASRATGQIAYFIKERLVLSDTTTGKEISRRFSDDDYGASIVQVYRDSIEAKSANVTISGLMPIKEWILPHPATNQTVAGVIMAWTPESMAAAERIRQAMSSTLPTRAPRTRSQAPLPRSERKRIILESPDPDTNAF